MDSRSKPSPSVLVTGAHGFTGYYVDDALRQAGMRVLATCAHDDGSNADAITLDIMDIEQCRRVIDQHRPDYILHLAAISFVAHADAEAFYRVNVIGTLNLLQACADTDHTPAKIVMASSANVYGNACEGVIAESQPPLPVNHYATSKIAMEFMVRTWFERFPIVITRPFNYTGRGQANHFLVPKIVSHFRKRAPVIELGNLDVARDFSDVRTVAQAYLGLLQSDVAGEIVNICSGRQQTLREIVFAMEQIAAYPIEVQVNPAFVRANEVRTLVGSSEKLDRLVPNLFRPDFKETLRWMFER